MDLLVENHNLLLVNGDFFLKDLSDSALFSRDVSMVFVMTSTTFAILAGVLGSLEVDIVEELVVSLEASHEASVVNMMALCL